MVETKRRVVVDPITRIEGHLRVEAMLDEEGVIRDALSSGTMWRGIEVYCGPRTLVPEADVFFRNDGGTWSYLDSGTGIACREPDSLTAETAAACEALGAA